MFIKEFTFLVLLEQYLRIASKNKKTVPMVGDQGLLLSPSNIKALFDVRPGYQDYLRAVIRVVETAQLCFGNSLLLDIFRLMDEPRYQLAMVNLLFIAKLQKSLRSLKRGNQFIQDCCLKLQQSHDQFYNMLLEVAKKEKLDRVEIV